MLLFGLFDKKTNFVALNYTLLSQVAFSLFSFIFAVQVIIHIVVCSYHFLVTTESPEIKASLKGP